jgi:hypothetical protein
LNRRELQFDSVELRNSRELVQSAVKKHGDEIRHASADRAKRRLRDADAGGGPYLRNGGLETYVVVSTIFRGSKNNEMDTSVRGWRIIQYQCILQKLNELGPEGATVFKGGIA